MRRECRHCSEPFEGRSSRALYCSPRCRVAANRAKKTEAEPAPLTVSEARSLIESVRFDLEVMGATGTTNGQLALLLARRIGSELESDNGTQLVTMLKELQALLASMSAAGDDLSAPANPLDEIAARRQRRGAV